MSMSPEIFVGITPNQDLNAKFPKSLSMDSTASPRLYLLRPDPEDCKCNVHGLETGKAYRYRQLAAKERRLYDELIKVNREMTNLTSSMLDNVCDMEETMKTIYKTDYAKRGLPVTRYRSLMAAIDSPVGLPITPACIALKDAYRDPTRFRSLAMESLTVPPVKMINLVNDKQVPVTCFFSDEPLTGCSEYMDTISKIGLINIKNQQRYLTSFSVLKKSGTCNSLLLQVII